MRSLLKWIKKYFHARNPNAILPNIYPYLKWDKPTIYNIERLSKRFPQFRWSGADYDKWFVETVDREFSRPRFNGDKDVDLTSLFCSIKMPKFRRSVGVVHGFDTESDKDGNIVCLSVSVQGVPQHPNSHKEKTFVGKDTFDYLEFLLEHGRHADYNFFWNIDYDFAGIIKEYLVTTKVKKLRRVYVNELGQRVEKENSFYVWKNGKRLTVSFLEDKYFKISDKKHSAYFWDIAQFYDRQSLDKAHEVCFGTSKGDYGLSNKDVGIGTDKLDMDKLYKRCELDAWFTRELGQRFLENTLNALGFLPTHLYSQASLSQAFFLNKVEGVYLKPFEGKDTLLIRKVIKYALNSYKGGIFLLTTKGMCSDVTELDIVSAYPSAIHDLPDLVHGEWEEVQCPNKNARFGFYHVAIQFDGLMPVYSPKKSEGILYPKTVKMYEDYITAIEYWYFKEHGIAVQFLDGVEFHGNASPVYPFAEAVDFCFERKQNALNETERMLWKIVLNAMYGKMAQDEPSIGMLFNPVYASYITARTRLKLRDMANYFEEVYSYDTDGIKGRLKSNVKILESKRLGGIEVKKHYRRLCFVKSGIVANDNEELIKSRGFGRDEDKQLHNVYWEKDCLVQFNPFHVFKIKECLRGDEITGWNGKKVRLNASYINRFSGDVFPSENPLKCGIVKRLNYVDDKRHWLFSWKEGKYDYDDILAGPIKSEPLNDGDLTTRGLLSYEEVRAKERK